MTGISNPARPGVGGHLGGLLAVPHAVSAAEHQLRVPRPLDGQQPRVLILGPEPGHRHSQAACLLSSCVYGPLLPRVPVQTVLGLAVVRVLAVSVGKIA